MEELTSGTAQLMPSYSPAPASVPVSQAAPAVTATASSAPAAGSGDLCAQMGGVVSSIFVKEGQSVAEGERVIELEAMKMKVPLMAARSGKVSRLMVASATQSRAGQPLLTIA